MKRGAPAWYQGRMNDDIQIRAARMSDQPALVGILHKAWHAAFAPHLSAGATQRYFGGQIAEGFVAEEWVAMLVAEVSGTVVGLAHTEDDLITAVQIDPVLWGRGIGRALLDAAERQIVARGYTEVRLQVDAFNARAEALYRAAGYVETARQPDTEFDSGTMTISMRKAMA